MQKISMQSSHHKCGKSYGGAGAAGARLRELVWRSEGGFMAGVEGAQVSWAK